MSDKALISLLIAAIVALSGAIVYLYKRGEKREKEMQLVVKDVMKALKNTDNLTEVLRKVEALLTNWRGH